jgi:hypothetical protein
VVDVVDITKDGEELPVKLIIRTVLLFAALATTFLSRGSTAFALASRHPRLSPSVGAPRPSLPDKPCSKSDRALCCRRSGL